MSTSPDSSATAFTTIDLTILRTAILRKARTDPCAFLQLVLTGQAGAHQPMAPLHRALQSHLSAHARALVELPRDHGKTTQACLRILWELGRNPNLRVKVVCASEAIALDRARYLRRLIEVNPWVRRVFPHLRKGHPWRAAGFTIPRRCGSVDSSVSAFGIGGTSTGNRADLLVCDDIVDVKSLHSKAERDRVADDFFNNILNLLEPDGRFWNLSTPWHADDLNARLKRNGSFALFRRPIRRMRPIWPARWPKAALKRRQREIGSAAFARGYRLTPIAADELVIRPEWVQYAVPPAAFDRVILSIDPAVSVKAGADESAIVALGLFGNAVHCLAAQTRRVAAPALVEWIAAMDELWKPEAIVFESNGAFDAVRELLTHHAAFGPKVLGVCQSKSKPARFAAFSVRVQNGTFRLNADGSQRDLFDQMTTFPFGERDDLLDAAATGAMHLQSHPRDPRIWIL